ncbi:hypothetical protein FI667_g15689, partial [Globisporangium splendens]
MEVQQQQPDDSLLTAPTASEGDSLMPSASPSKDLDRSTFQTDSASLSPPKVMKASSSSDSASPLSTPSTSSSPVKGDARKTSQCNSESEDVVHVVCEEPTGIDPTRSMKDSAWMDNTDAESGFSEPDDSQVAPFDFGSTNGESSMPKGSKEEPTKADPPLLVIEPKASPQRESTHDPNEDLTSLPPPVANPTPAFDVFATSHTDIIDDLELYNGEAAVSGTSQQEKSMNELLESATADLNLTINREDDPVVSHEDDSSPQEESTVLSQDSSLDKQTKVVSEPNLIVTLEQGFTDLPVASASAAPSLSSERTGEGEYAQPLLPPTEGPVTTNISALTTPGESMDDFDASDSSSPGSSLPSLRDPAKRCEDGVSAGAGVECEVAKEVPASSNPSPRIDDASVATGVNSGKATVPASNTPSPTERESEAKAASTPKHAVSSRSLPKPEKAKKTEPANPPSKGASAKERRVPRHETVSKGKPSDSLKAPTPSTTASSKPLTADRYDKSTNSTLSATAKANPPKPRAQRTVPPPQTHTPEKPTLTAKKSASSAPPAPSKRGQAPSPITPAKQSPSSATPPPAPVSASGAEAGQGLKKRLSSSEIEASSNRLYADAQESKKRKEARKAELEESFTFAPQVNKFKRRNAPEEPNRFLLLHERATEASKRKEQLKQKLEKSECTFKPKITAKARKLAAKSSKPRYENLYQQAQEIQMKREEKKNEMEQKAVDECSFKPKIKSMKSPAKSRPLYDAERLKQKKLELEQKKLETELSQCTFKPKVVAKNPKLKADDATGKVAGEEKLFDRLYQASQQRAERLEKLRQEHHAHEKMIATFQPKITSSSGNAKGTSKQPFHERLYSKDYMQKVTADREQKKLEDEQKFSFKPKISEVPEEIKSKQRSASVSPDKSIFERLYEEKDKVKEKIELSEELKMQKEMVECTFRPQIETSPTKNHPNSQPAVPIWERLLSYDKNQVVEEREKLREQMEMQECTFKPEVKPLDTFAPKRSPSTGIFDRLAGGAFSVPSSSLKRRESERDYGSPQPKRNSVPELERFQFIVGDQRHISNLWEAQERRFSVADVDALQQRVGFPVHCGEERIAIARIIAQHTISTDQLETKVVNVRSNVTRRVMKMSVKAKYEDGNSYETQDTFMDSTSLRQQRSFLRRGNSMRSTTVSDGDAVEYDESVVAAMRLITESLLDEQPSAGHHEDYGDLIDFHVGSARESSSAAGEDSHGDGEAAPLWKRRNTKTIEPLALPDDPGDLELHQRQMFMEANRFSRFSSKNFLIASNRSLMSAKASMRQLGAASPMSLGSVGSFRNGGDSGSVAEEHDEGACDGVSGLLNGDEHSGENDPATVFDEEQYIRWRTEVKAEYLAWIVAKVEAKKRRRETLKKEAGKKPHWLLLYEASKRPEPKEPKK